MGRYLEHELRHDDAEADREHWSRGTTRTIRVTCAGQSRAGFSVANGTKRRPVPVGDAGDFEFTLSADGKSFTGRWRYSTAGAAWNTDWRGTCTRGACAGTPVGYKLLLWTTKPDGRVHSRGDTNQPREQGRKAGLQFVDADAGRIAAGAVPDLVRAAPARRPFGNGSLHSLVVCTNGSPRPGTVASTALGIRCRGRVCKDSTSPRVRRERTCIDMPITRFFRVTGP